MSIRFTAGFVYFVGNSSSTPAIFSVRKLFIFSFAIFYGFTGTITHSFLTNQSPRNKLFADSAGHFLSGSYFITVERREMALLSKYLRATRVARNPNLNVAIEHAWHVCRLMLARFLWTSTKNEWNE